MKITFLSNFLKLQKTILLLSVSLALFARQAQANNIAVSNASIVGQNTTAGVNNAANFSLVKFDLSWENSWRTATGPSNWDAAWVFVKFRVGASDPTFSGVSSSGAYWTNTISSNFSKLHYCDASSSSINMNFCASCYSIRCIKD
jgi:hypothetical protein